VVHVGVERFDICGEKEPVWVDGLILYFINDMKSVFYIRGMFVRIGL